MSNVGREKGHRIRGRNGDEDDHSSENFARRKTILHEGPTNGTLTIRPFN